MESQVAIQAKAQAKTHPKLKPKLKPKMCVLSSVPGAVGGAVAVLGAAGALVLLAHVQLVQGSAPSGARFNALEKHHENHWSIEQLTCSIVKCSIVQSD